MPLGSGTILSLGGSAAKSSNSSNSARTSPSRSSRSKTGSIIVGATNSQKRSTYDHVDVAASDVSVTSKFPVTVTADLPSGGKFQARWVVGPIDQADTALTPLSAKLNFSSLNLASTGFLDPSMGLGAFSISTVRLNRKAAKLKPRATLNSPKPYSSLVVRPPVFPHRGFQYQLQSPQERGASSIPPRSRSAAPQRAFMAPMNPPEATVLNIKLEGRTCRRRISRRFFPPLGIHLPKGASLQGGALQPDLTLSGSHQQTRHDRHGRPLQREA